MFLLCAGSSAEEIRLQLFNNGYCTGNPDMFIRKNRDMIQIYSNGYGTGNPEVSIRGAASTKDVIELFLLSFVIGMW